MQTPATSPAQGNTQSEGKKFIDFITYGTGLVTRARFVNGRKLKTPALYCTIAVPLDERGTANGRWTTFDVRVLGKENLKLIESLIPAVTDGKRPRVHFSIGDAYADPYWKQTADEKRPRAQFKGRLLRVSLAKDEPQRELLSHGLAYINELDHGRTRLDIGMIHGSVDALEKTYVTCNLPKELDPEMEKALDTVIAAQGSNAKVFASVVIRDLSCSAFVFRDESKQAGQLGVNVNSVLQSLRWIRVEGEKVYVRPKAQPQETAAAEVQTEPVPATDTQADADEEAQWSGNYLQAYPGQDDDYPF